MMSDESGTLIGMVALKSPSLPAASAIASAFSRRCPNSSIDNDIDDKGGTFVFRLDGNMAAIYLLPVPIPWSDLEGPCATAWWWPDATERMKSHTAHAIVALMGDSCDVIQRHIQLTHLVAAVAATADAAGVYWGSGTVVHEPQAFVEQSAGLSRDDVEPQLWIDMRLEQNDDGSYRYFTTGMASFGHLEIEIDRATLEPEEILEFCYAIINYILTSGNTVKHGETLGRSAEEKIKVTHESSMWDREGKVMKLAFS
jgi:Domain of unknown function (DUF4261)